MLSQLVVVTSMKVAGTVLWLVYTVVLARLLAAADYGLAMYAVTLMMIAGPLACLGLNSAMLRFGAVYWKQSRIPALRALLGEGRRVILLASAPAALATVLLLVAIGDTEAPLGPTALALAAAGVPLYGLMVLHRETLRALDRTAAAFLGFNIVRSAVPGLLSVGLWAAGWLTVESALGAMVAGLLAIAALDSGRIGRAVPPAAPDAAGERAAWYGVARPMVVTEALSHWLARGDVLIVGAAVGLTEAAIYLTAQRLAMLVNFVLDAARMALEPAVARSYEQGDRAGLQALLAEGSLLALLAGAPVALALVAGGPLLLGLYGPAFTDGWTVLAILAAGQFTTVLVGPVSAVLRMAGLQGPLTTLSAIASVGQALAVTAGVLAAGIEGAAIAAALVLAATNLGFVVVVRRRLGLRSGLGSGMFRRGMLSAMLRDLRRRPALADRPRVVEAGEEGI